MRKLLILSCCLLLSACAGNRTLDGETTKNWVKIVSSKIDKSGNVRDVCYIFNLSFYPGSVYERLENNPDTCLEECCWYSENKSVDFYFNDGFVRDLEENGVSRRYYPDHIQINLTYAPFLNRLSAKASSPEGISKDGIVMLEYEDIYKPENINDTSLGSIEAKVYPEDLAAAKKKKKGPVTYKTVSISGLNREELLTRAKNERDAYNAALEEGGEALEEDVSSFEEEVEETKSLAKKPLTKEERAKQKARVENEIQEAEETVETTVTTVKKTKTNAKNKAKDTMYDVKRTLSQEATIVYIEPKMPEKIDETTLSKKVAYERKEAVNLLKRFYGDEIDAYLLALDKAKRESGQLLITNNKAWQAQKIGTTVYKVSCDVKGQLVSTTKSGTEKEDYPIACGTYVVNLDEKTVEAKDDLAKKIARKRY